MPGPSASRSDTTRAMTENIGQVSAGIQEVNENVAQSSQVSAQVAAEICRGGWPRLNLLRSLFRQCQTKGRHP
ncbi:MAG: hypothetical protein U5K27_01925 [Desulfotignum sp.]|nr:hypothetical protein [Desulfotignum sp.]